MACHKVDNLLGKRNGAYEITEIAKRGWIEETAVDEGSSDLRNYLISGLEKSPRSSIFKLAVTESLKVREQRNHPVSSHVQVGDYNFLSGAAT